MASRSSKIDCGLPIEIGKYALDILVERVDSLQNALEEMKQFKPTELFAKSQHFYYDFQESYDLYFFIYLGHFLRHSHYATQPYKRNPKNMVNYYVMKAKNPKPVQHDYFWSHCVTYLLVL